MHDDTNETQWLQALQTPDNTTNFKAVSNDICFS